MSININNFPFSIFYTFAIAYLKNTLTQNVSLAVEVCVFMSLSKCLCPTVVMCSGQARNPKPEGPTGFLANPKKPEPDIPGPRPEIFMHKMVKRYLSSHSLADCSHIFFVKFYKNILGTHFIYFRLQF